MKQLTFMIAILTMLLVATLGRGEGDHEDDPIIPPVKVKPPPRPTVSKGIGGCEIAPGSLSQFAIGERYDLHSMVTFLTQPECIENSRTISAMEMSSEGVKFSATSPVNLLNLTKGLSPKDYDALRKLDASLSKSVPNALRVNPLGQNELLSLVGQMSLLSPQAARFGMVKLMEQELFAADPVLSAKTSSAGEKKQTAKELALNLVRLGANEPVLIAEFASNVEDMAVTAQADSLSKVFRGLAMATDYEPTLVPTFNASAGALNRGVGKSAPLISKSDKAALTAAIFTAIATSANGNERLDPGASDLNDAISLLIDGKPLQLTSLKKVWREILRVLAVTASQSALADALALSLTPDMVFLPEGDRKLMLEAAMNYPTIGFAIQNQSVAAVESLRADVKKNRIAPQKYNEIRSRSLLPLVSQLLSWETLKIHPLWIKKMAETSMISDEDVEKKMPRHTLALLENWSDSLKGVNERSGADLWTAASTRSFVLHWTLNKAYLPALSKWVKRFEGEASDGTESQSSDEESPSNE